MRISKRRPLRNLGLAAVVGLAAVMSGARSDAQPAPTPRPPAPVPGVTLSPNPVATLAPNVVAIQRCSLFPRVRRSVAALTPAQITTLRNGVAAMKAKPATDPTSWLYQANIHGTFDTPVKTAWILPEQQLLIHVVEQVYLYTSSAS